METFEVSKTDTTEVEYLITKLTEIDFINHLINTIETNGSNTERGKAMKNQLIWFVATYSSLLLSKIAIVLSMCKQPAAANHLIPIFRFVEVEVFDDPKARTKQLVNFTLTALHTANILRSDYKTIHCIWEIPEFPVMYPKPHTYIILNEQVLGSILDKRANAHLDKNMEAMYYMSRPKLRINSTWKDKPEMAKPKEETSEKMAAYSNYTVHIGESLNEVAEMKYFRPSHKQDIRGRCYVDKNSINYTGIKQLRCLIESAVPEKVEINQIKKGTIVDLPELD